MTIIVFIEIPVECAQPCATATSVCSKPSATSNPSAAATSSALPNRSCGFTPHPSSACKLRRLCGHGTLSRLLETAAYLRYQAGMRLVLIALLLATSLPAAYAADDKRPAAKQTTFPKQARGNPCTVYGPGFVQVEGGSTCVRIGGALDVGAGVSSRR
ncbi:hypothetical protein LPW26_07175 [Rhodopseudomonas sp. HC1]|uniref:hypothetical protein n=1 Tax=Rhodopseudomonas infernalis TaxID=2897386 RepID=UPI001EE91895|nr:hypothetical protein [Rhodopseudomonas infernalis]MCG6204410.1 hypothetical protein [Rhodopseudomonas infernalis]